jgi:hypothetical protein
MSEEEKQDLVKIKKEYIPNSMVAEVGVWATVYRAYINLETGKREYELVSNENERTVASIDTDEKKEAEQHVLEKINSFLDGWNHIVDKKKVEEEIMKDG